MSFRAIGQNAGKTLLERGKMICQKCWGDAYLETQETGESQHAEYKKLLEERKDNLCFSGGLPLPLLVTERTYWLKRVKQIDNRTTVGEFINWWKGLKE